jgi:hypothetical protein
MMQNNIDSYDEANKKYYVTVSAVFGKLKIKFSKNIILFDRFNEINQI